MVEFTHADPERRIEAIQKWRMKAISEAVIMKRLWVLVNLGINTQDIRSMHSPLERENRVRLFNSEDDDHMMLITST